MANRFRRRLSQFILSTTNNLVSFEKPYRVMANLLKDHPITGIIDAGASNGSVSKRLLHFFPEANAYAFEPNPLYKEMLISYSNAEKRLKPEFKALSDHEGQTTLYVTQAPGSTSLLRPLNVTDENYSQRMKIKNEEIVDVVTIDGWMASKRNVDIQLLKFDIQGGELSALKGATHALGNSILLIYTEILFTPLYQKGALYSEIDLFLRKFGFELYDIYSPKYNTKGQLAYANAIFLNSEKMAEC